jgi:hypothetical protein
VNGGTFQLHVTTREDAFRVTSIDGVQVMGGVLSAGPVDAVPAPAPGGGGMTASTCGLSGIATVVIPDPNLTTLNVRDKPNGNILPTKIPENAQVNVVGGCGVQLSAGIVAPQPGQVIPGWCAISSPVVGCVAEQFLVAGIPAGGPLGAGSAGLVANPPQTIPQPQPQPQPQVGALPPVVAVPAAGGGQVARLTQGANIRNAASGSAKAKTGSSLPGGTIVTVLECVPSWCRIALPQFPVAWVSRDFLAFDVAGAPAPASVDVTINIGGGGVAPAPVQPPAPPATGGGGLTASICGLPGGTATVVIPDPKITTLNVRDKPSGSILTKIPENTQVTVVGGCGVQLSAGIVAPTPGTGGQPVPGWCAISSPVIGCVSEQFLVAGIPAGGPVGAGSAGLVANPPQAVAAPSFTGTWSAEAQGSGYTFTLNQNGNTVTGNYSGGDGSNGQINGNVSGNVLRFAWEQRNPELSGAGKFTLSGDGNSFDGSYTLGSDPDVAEGSWNGTRQ